MENLKDWASFAVVVALIGAAAFFLTNSNHERDKAQSQKSAAVLSSEGETTAKSYSSDTDYGHDYSEPEDGYDDSGEPQDESEDDNDYVYWRNCTEAKSNGAYNIARGEPGYRSELDRDGDGYACEPYYGR